MGDCWVFVSQMGILEKPVWETGPTVCCCDGCLLGICNSNRHSGEARLGKQALHVW